MSRPPTSPEIRAINARLSRRRPSDVVRSSFIPHEDTISVPTPAPPQSPIFSPPSPQQNPIPRILANITKVVEFEDPIMMTTEEIHVEKYILEDPDNVVIVYGDNKYFFTNRQTIYNQADDATVYPCKTKGVDAMTIYENIDDHVENRPLYDLKKIGLIVPFCDIMVLFENREVQLFGLIEDNKIYPSFISKNYLQGQSGYGALHCQDGQKSYITRMVAAVPSTIDNPTRSISRSRNRRRSRSNSSRDQNVTRRRQRRRER